MLKQRLIPVLLLQDEGLYKTIKFKDAKYLGDPINAVKLFNDKEVDEIIILDINATAGNHPLNIEYIERLTSEAFMPLAYGGGVKTVEQAKKLLRLGVEKIIVNSAIFTHTDNVREMVKVLGASTIVASIDVKKSFLGKYEVFYKNGTLKYKGTLKEALELVNDIGVGEVMVNAIDKDGTMNGYDLGLVKIIEPLINAPIIICGGLGQLEHLKQVTNSAISGFAGGSFFVYHGPLKAVLITYPAYNTLHEILK
ncbi:AglZ/HisF2 family acetamidino modification protein [Polluticaenibacter yanchengensis]|uniref:imidazole glycerol-phosphate synthase n=1 Tax=Polluticaenibacter yanchengensis TaxID=3014562 RepID=A0ABT4UIA1_9BACT|nr:AglZ/HisF2 family acetamidino modification protein [Chitinophagaceae bacterium LY-5]